MMNGFTVNRQSSHIEGRRKIRYQSGTQPGRTGAHDFCRFPGKRMKITIRSTRRADNES